MYKYLLTVNVLTPKKTLFIVGMAVMVASLSCNKVLGKTCWKCTVTRFGGGSTYNKTVCTDDDNPPQFTDDNGNDLNSVCEKK